MRALSGIRVVDLTRVVAGPYCTYQLALLGADCIKLEEVGRGDPVRHSAAGTDAFYYQHGMATNFLPQNANKRSMTLNLKLEAGRKIFLQLAERADVVVENFRAGVMDSLGIGYTTLTARNPRLIFCSLTAYGQDPPKGGHTAYDGVIQAFAGLMSVIGTRESGPIKVGPPITDYATGMAAAFAIMTALYQRERDGSGQYIDVSMLDTALTLMSSYVTDYFGTGNPPGPRGNEPASRSPSAGTYDTLEGKLVLGANEDHQYRRLCRALGLAHLLADPRFEQVEERRKNRDELYREFSRVLRTRGAAQWEEILNAAGVPAARVQTVAEALAHPQVTGRGVLHTFGKVPGIERDVTVLLSPFRFRHDGPEAEQPPPRVGEHTEAVLRDLGYGVAEIARLREEGVI